MTRLRGAFRSRLPKHGHRTSSARRRISAPALILWLAACASGTEPEPQAELELVRPYLTALEIRVFDAPIGPMLWIEGVAAEAIQENEAASVAVSTSTGSSAEVLIPRSMCGILSSLRICRQVSVTMKPGRGAVELHEFLAGLDAAFVWTYVVDGSAAGVVEVFSGSTATVRERIHGHPAVEVAEDAGTGTPGWDLAYEPQRHLRVAVPTLDTDPAPPSARLRLVPGDTVTARHRQPDGSELTASTVVPVR